MLTLAISCMNTSSFPWFMDLICHAPMQCSLQHRTSLSPADTLTAECPFHFGPGTLLFWEVLVIVYHSSSVACWTLPDLGGSSSRVICVCLFKLFMVLSRQEYWLLLLLLSRSSCVWLCATPQTAAHQAPLSLGFSRPEHWSGLPFPSPMHACMHAKSFQSCLIPCNPIDGSPPGSSVPGILQAGILEWVAVSFCSRP